MIRRERLQDALDDPRIPDLPYDLNEMVERILSLEEDDPRIVRTLRLLDEYKGMSIAERLVRRELIGDFMRSTASSPQQIECARCGAPMLAQAPGNSADNGAMEVCSLCVEALLQEAVREVHYPDPYFPSQCASCETDWPCPTEEAITRRSH